MRYVAWSIFIGMVLLGIIIALGYIYFMVKINLLLGIFVAGGVCYSEWRYWHQKK
jgi:hypothetical protein